MAQVTVVLHPLDPGHQHHQGAHHDGDCCHGRMMGEMVVASVEDVIPGKVTCSLTELFLEEGLKRDRMNEK